MTFLRSLLLKLNGKVSKAKATALIGLVLTLLQQFGVLHLSQEDLNAATVALVTLYAIFLRSGMDEDTEK